MREVLRVLTGKHSILVVLTTLIVLDLVMIAAIFSPTIKTFISQSNTFQVVVITCLLQIILLLTTHLFKETPLVISLDDLAQRRVKELLEEDDNIVSIRILSAGMSSRAGFIRGLLEHPRKLDISVVACFSEANPDELDREDYGPTHFSVVTHRLQPGEEKRLRIYQSFNSPSVRCVILSSSVGPRHAFLGWYTYNNRNKHIQGRRNIQFQVDGTTSFGIEMLHFANNTFERYANDEEAELIWPPSPAGTTPIAE